MLPLTFILLLLFSTTAIASPRNTTDFSVYDVLRYYNFPIGLLPEGVLGYSLDEDTGKFAAYLDGKCRFSLQGSYDIEYEQTINGYIFENRLKSLSGVRVKVLIVWLNIVEVVRKGEELRFSVGIASEGYPASDFNACPRCGCGFDCVAATGEGGVAGM